MPPLTSRERVARVLAGELPDRVPVLMQNFQNTAYLAGMTLHEFCRSGARMAEAQLAAWERFGYDVIDLENGTAALAEACGCEVEYPEHEPPRVVRPVLRSLADVGRLRPVDPARDGMLPELLDATRRVQAGLAGRACVKGEADQGPFDLAALLLGPEPFLMALMQPEQHADVHRLLEYCYEQVQALRPGPGRGRCGFHRDRRLHGRAGRLLAAHLPPVRASLRGPAGRRPGRARGAAGPPHLRQHHGDHGRHRHHRRDDDRVRLQGRHGALPRRGAGRHAGGQRGSQRRDGAGHARAGARGEPPRHRSVGQERALHPQPRLHAARDHPAGERRGDDGGRAYLRAVPEDGLTDKLRLAAD